MKLVEYLKKHNLTQSDFGKMVGKKQTTISGYCTGALIPPRATALRIVEETKGKVKLSDLWGTGA